MQNVVVNSRVQGGYPGFQRRMPMFAPNVLRASASTKQTSNRTSIKWDECGDAATMLVHGKRCCRTRKSLFLSGNLLCGFVFGKTPYRVHRNRDFHWFDQTGFLPQFHELREVPLRDCYGVGCTRNCFSLVRMKPGSQNYFEQLRIRMA